MCMSFRKFSGGRLVNTKHFRIRPHVGFALSVLTAMALPSAAIFCWSDAQAGTPAYNIDFHIISAGGTPMRGSCFHLSGTVAQAAPGYSSGSIYALSAGYWQAVPDSASDEIFFNGFEGCSI